MFPLRNRYKNGDGNALFHPVEGQAERKHLFVYGRKGSNLDLVINVTDNTQNSLKLTDEA